MFVVVTCRIEKQTWPRDITFGCKSPAEVETIVACGVFNLFYHALASRGIKVSEFKRHRELPFLNQLVRARPPVAWAKEGESIQLHASTLGRFCDTHGTRVRQIPRTERFCKTVTNTLSGSHARHFPNRTSQRTIQTINPH